MGFPLIFASIGTTITANVPFNSASSRIVGGYEVLPKFRYPWMVSLAHNGIHNCGGTLFNGNTVIAASHSAHVHRYDLEEDESFEHGRIYTIKSRIAHPNYDTNTNDFDFFIWKLNTAAESSIDVELDNGEYASTEHIRLKVIGWGHTSHKGEGSAILLEVKLPVYNERRCKKVYSYLDTESQFCAGYLEGGKDSCQGDSGGPIFTEKGTTPILVGVVSWGERCGDSGKPGVYTRASAVADFIHQHSK
ncbi:trypsin-like serine protease [Neoconidiobolus thromboides FSU 785]|nr:trypsin-like serine protease [Neoconidiobolus thromboides FSU 785]